MLTALKSRTIQFSILLAVLGVVQASSGVFAPYMTPQAYGIFTIVIGIVVAILRIITTTPILNKE